MNYYLRVDSINAAFFPGKLLSTSKGKETGDSYLVIHQEPTSTPGI